MLKNTNRNYALSLFDAQGKSIRVISLPSDFTFGKLHELCLEANAASARMVHRM